MVSREHLTAALPGYDLAEELGRGGWGVVYRATHRTLDRKVAIKELPAAFSGDPSARDRFRSEARVVASLDHPHIVPLYDFVEDGDTCVFVMELMTGGTLWDRFSAGEVSREAACNITMAMLGALNHAHRRGVLHRDVKPENVLFNAEGIPKLADFGIAKVIGDGAGNRTATGMIMGTPAYMAPEQGSGDPVGPATDLYAVGVMLYELLAGRLPFESTGNPVTQLYRHVHEKPEPLDALAPDVPRPIAAVVMQALEKAPADRFDDAAAFAAALNGAANDCLGEDWATRSGVTVLATRAMLGTSRRSDPGSGTVTGVPSGAPQATVAPGGTAPPSAPTGSPSAGAGGPSSGSWAPSPGTGTPPPSLGPVPQGPPSAGAWAPATGGQGPSPAPGPASGSYHAGPAGGYAGPTPTPGGPSAPARGSSGRGLLVGLSAALVVVVAAIVAVLVLRGGDDPPAAPVADAPDPAAEAAELAAAERRLEAACDERGVDPEVCTCAIELSRTELTPEQFLANDLLIQQTGVQLTDEVRLRFERCQAQLQGP